MRFKNIRELKLETNSVLEETAQYGPTIITRKGRPVALLRPITEDDLYVKTDSLWPKLRKSAERSGYGLRDVARVIKSTRKPSKNK